MNKKIKVFIFIIFFFIITPSVYAAPTSEDEKCSDIIEMVDEYESITSELDSLACDRVMDDNSTNDFELLSSCNNLYSKKSYLLSKMFKTNETIGDCETTRFSEIINENKDECSPVLDSSIKDIADRVMNIFYIIAPFLVIIFGSLDFAKIVVSNNPNEIKKNRKNFIRRIIAMVLLFLSPALLKFIFNFNFSGYSLDGNVYACKRPFNFSIGHWDVTYVPTTPQTERRITSRTSSGISSTNGQAIADAAKEIKEYVVANGYSWCGNNLPVEDQATSKTKCIVCATLVRTSLYRAGIYDRDEANSISNNSAPTVARNLVAKGWIPIWNAEDLQPGDVLLYQKLTNIGDCGKATIDGKTYYVPHVDIYYGNGKKVTTGDWPVMKAPAVVNFSTGLGSFSGGQGKWLCGLRYPGN